MLITMRFLIHTIFNTRGFQHMRSLTITCDFSFMAQTELLHGESDHHAARPCLIIAMMTRDGGHARDVLKKTALDYKWAQALRSRHHNERVKSPGRALRRSWR